MQIKIAIEGELQLSRRLSNMAASATDWGPALQQSADDLKHTFSGPVFDTQGAEIDEPWAPLSTNYVKTKQKKYPDKGILEATGDMRRGFVSSFDSTSARIWNVMTYFKYHQSREPRTKLPRRVMMKLTQNLKQVVVKNFQEYFRDNIMQ